MTAGEEPVRVDDPLTADDALSLHTIAEADAYASQEQEDADLALALALEEQESQRYARTQAIMQGYDPNRVTAPEPAPTDTLAPYRDDPAADVVDEDDNGNLPPYRDDPDDVPAEGEADEAVIEPAKRSRAFIRAIRKFLSIWSCYIMWSIIIVMVIGIVVSGMIIRGIIPRPGETPKEAAWRESKSKDYRLKLWKLYPPLEAGASEDCKDAWRTAEETQSLACHRMILSSAWDNGDADEVNAGKADPYYWSEAVCTATCRGSLTRMATPLNKNCTVRTDRFDLAKYAKNRRAYFEKGKIEENPVHVAKNLLERFNRFCNLPNQRHRRSEWGTCAADLWMNWGIVDGKNEAHLNGLDQFLEQTSTKETLPAESRQVSYWRSDHEDGTNTVQVPRRNVGPGVGETSCSSCTLDWLERKMRSFEFGQFLDAKTGKPLGLSEFREKLRSAIRRCSVTNGAPRRVDRIWMELGWWCDDQPCEGSDNPFFSPVTLAILHGWPKDANRLSDSDKKEFSKEMLKGWNVLHDAMRDMPCGVGFSELIAKDQIVPHEHIVSRLCSNQCRNPFDRLINEHGSLFTKLRNHPKYGEIFTYPYKATELLDRTCLSTTPNALSPKSEDLCAPGYAAVGHPEWMFSGETYDPPTRPEILNAFSREIDALAARLPSRVSWPGVDPVSQRIQTKKLAESACNTCAGSIFIGSEPDWKKTVDEYLNDKDVNGTEYVAAAKKGWVTCAKMHGKELTEWEKREMWRLFGLDRYD